MPFGGSLPLRVPSAGDVSCCVTRLSLSGLLVEALPLPASLVLSLELGASPLAAAEAEGGGTEVMVERRMF